MSASASEAVEKLTDRKYTDVCLMVNSPGAPIRAVSREVGELPGKLLTRFHRVIDSALQNRFDHFANL